MRERAMTATGAYKRRASVRVAARARQRAGVASRERSVRRGSALTVSAVTLNAAAFVSLAVHQRPEESLDNARMSRRVLIPLANANPEVVTDKALVNAREAQAVRQAHNALLASALTACAATKRALVRAIRATRI